MKLILASSSASRLILLSALKIVPDVIEPAELDETPKYKEMPIKLAVRLAQEKAQVVSKNHQNGYILAADTVTAVGRRILPKAMTKEDVRACLLLLSGRRHHVYTGVSVNKIVDNILVGSANKLVKTILKFKKLTPDEIDKYVLSDEGLEKSGGCNIEGLAAAFVSFLSGSHSNVRGLPLHETYLMLKGLGYKI